MNYSIYGNHGMVKYCRTSPHLQDNIPSSQNYCLSKAYERDTIPNYKLHIYIYIWNYIFSCMIENAITYIMGSTYIFTHEPWGHHDDPDVFYPSLRITAPQGAPSNCKESANRSRTKSRPCQLRWIRWKFLEMPICWWITCGYVIQII